MVSAVRQTQAISDASARVAEPTTEPLANQVRVRRVWFTMVQIPSQGWTRVGKAYGSQESASGWLGFVSSAWRGLRTKTSRLTLRWQNGVLDERCRRILSAKFNMDPPDKMPADAR